MPCVYSINYHIGTYPSAVIDTKNVYTNDTQDIAPNNARMTILSPYVYGQYADTGNTVSVKYHPIRADGVGNLGIDNWFVDEPIYCEYKDSWSSSVVIGSQFISSVYWAVMEDVEGTTYYSLDLYKVRNREVVQLSCPKTTTFPGFYSKDNRAYLTINYGYKDSEKIALDSQVNYRVTMKNWIVENGSPSTPGTSRYMPYNGESSFVLDGVFANISHEQSGSAKTFQQLLTNINTNRPADLTSFKIQLESSKSGFHETEFCDVSSSKYYAFNGWKTSEQPISSSNTLNMDNTPTTKDVSIYADWAVEEVVVHDKFPLWTTSELLPYGTAPVSYVKLRCYVKPGGEVYYEKSFGKYISKQAKHVSWIDDTTMYSIGDLIPLKEGAVYRATWVPDDAAESIYSIPENQVILPSPPQRPGFTHLGFSESETNTQPDYNPGSTIRIDMDINLFGIWKANGAAKLYLEDDKCKSYQVWIFDGSQWRLYMPRVFNGTEWKIVI